MTPPFFTILIPSFSQIAQTRATVASLINQTFADIEVLVCDNWSMDETYEEFSKHPDTRVRAEATTCSTFWACGPLAKSFFMRSH